MKLKVLVMLLVMILMTFNSIIFFMIHDSVKDKKADNK